MKKKLSMYAIISIALILFSCAPTKKYIQTSDAYKNQIKNTDTLGIISDVCIAINPLLKKKYILVDNSNKAEFQILGATRNYLGEKGYIINYTSSPFIGSWIKPELSFRIADTRGAKIKVENPPFAYNDLRENDEEYRQALNKVIKEVYYVVKDKEEKSFSIRSDIKECLKVISKRTGNDMMLFVIGDGTIIKFGKQVVEFLASSTGTLLLSSAIFSSIGLPDYFIVYWYYHKSYFDSWIALLDLRNGKLLWSNSGRLEQNPSKQEFYSKTWSNSLLYYFPEKK